MITEPTEREIVTWIKTLNCNDCGVNIDECCCLDDMRGRQLKREVDLD